MRDDVTVVVVTYNALPWLERCLESVRGYDTIVVDNGSTDGSAEVVGTRFPYVELMALDRNVGAPARNLGAARASTPYVAFADDDSWWASGALDRAADHFDRHRRLGLLAARILVGPDERLDPVSAAMAASPIPPDADLPGRPVVGFLACGAVVRREAFLAIGGFDEFLFFAGEEAMVAMDMVAAGWGVTYVADVVAHHHPSAVQDRSDRRRRQLRNDLLVTWLRRPVGVAFRRSVELARRGVSDAAARGALAEAVIRAPATARRRRPTPERVERLLRLVEE
jgi:GT2 family glycosyltransferase